MASGIVLDYHYTVSSLGWITFFAFFAVGYLISEIIYTTLLKSYAYNSVIICYLGIIITFGAAWHSLWDYRETPAESEVLNTYTWEEVTFYGTIQQIKETSTGKYQVDVAVDSTVFPDNLGWGKSYRIRAVLNPDDITLPFKPRLGNYITFAATVYPLEEKRNPSQFDYKQYLASQGIYTQVGIREINKLSPINKSWSWTILRRYVLQAIDNNFSEQTASLAKALLIGYKNELDRKEKITFSRAGLSHIMAVSGLHVGFILAPFWFLIPFFWTIRYGKQICLTLLMALLYCYAGLTDFSASVTRASLVGILLAYGKLFHKVRDSKNLTAVAALLILLFNPSDLFSIGFQLSFGAVYAILLTAPVIQQWLPDWIRFRWIGTPVMVIIISFIVQVALFPLLTYYFGEFSLVGPLANAFVIPFLGVAVPFALLLLPLAMAFPQLASNLNTPVDYFLSWLNWFVNVTANWPWSWIQVHMESILFFGIWIAAIFFIAALPIPKMRWKLLSVVLLLLCVDQAHKVIQKFKPATLEVTFFDVGQGDAALITTPNGKNVLMDAGRWQPDYNSARYIIIPHLKEQGIRKLNTLFLSHPHADHIGGILELIDSIPIDTIYNSGADYDSQLYHSYHRKAANHQIPIVSLSAGDQVPLDPALRMFVYGPSPHASNSNVNNHSLILELIYGDTEFLFMGDAEQAQEQRLINNFPNLVKTDFLKVGHHGSKTSSTYRFLEIATPEMGIVSLAKQNQFKHPHHEATQRLHQNIDTLYYTSLKGAVQFFSDGYSIHERSN